MKTDSLSEVLLFVNKTELINLKGNAGPSSQFGLTI
jgi:hypothetical protein